jgi:hypothetical protein
MSIRSFTRMAALAGRAMAAKRGLVSRRSRLNETGVQGLEGRLGVVQHDLDHPLHQHPLDGGVGSALDAHGRGAATAAQQHVDDRVDQVGVDRQQAVVVQLLGPEHRQDGRQRDRVQIVAEADRRDVVEADLDVVGGEVAQGRRHQPHQAVEDDLQHRQALVRDQGRVDDGADAGAVEPSPSPEMSKPSRLSISSWFRIALGAHAALPPSSSPSRRSKSRTRIARVGFSEALGHRGLIVISSCFDQDGGDQHLLDQHRAPWRARRSD